MSDVETGDGNQKPSFLCDSCGLSYSRAEYLRRHQRKHTQTRPFQCQDCPKDFSRSDVLLRHRRRCHPEEAAADLLNAPPPAAPTTKKPSRPRNRAAARPYPAPLTKQLSASTSPPPDADDMDENPDIYDPQPNLSATDYDTSFLRGSSVQITNSQAQTLADSSIFPNVPDLSWSPISDLSGPSSSSDRSQLSISPLFDTPSLAESFDSDLPPAALDLSSNFIGIFQNPKPVFAPYRAIGGFGVTESQPVESQEIVPARKLSQFGSWYAFPPIEDGPSPDELFDLVKTGQWGDLNEHGVDIFSSEYQMIHSEAKVARPRGTTGLDPSHKFYLPPGLFAGCYTVPHWLLPPLDRLSQFAADTFSRVLVHFGLVHEPTFKLSESHAWIGFAVCTARAAKTSQVRPLPGKEPLEEPWDSVQDIVRTEKSDMFFGLFSRMGANMPMRDSVAGLQALLLYNAHLFLSEDPADRLFGDMFLSNIAKFARRCGLYNPTADHAKTKFDPEQTSEEEWREWIKMEIFRRTAWLLYFLDVLSSLEANSNLLVWPSDVKHLPLPAPGSIWDATSSHVWASQMIKPTGVGFSLEFVLEKMFDFSGTDISLDGSTSSILDVLELGPFARLSVVVTILRGLIEFGEGKPNGGYVVQRWIRTSSMFDPSAKDPNHLILSIFEKGLARWKKGWDFDKLCYFDTNPQGYAPDHIFIHNAMPYYWMSLMLLQTLTTPQDHGARIVNMDGPVNWLQGQDLRGMLQTARDITRRNVATW